MSKSLIVGAGDTYSHVHDPAPAGTYIARCVEIIHIGTVPTEYQGQQKMRNLIRMSWELPSKTKVWKEGEPPKPYMVNQKFTLHLGETSKLRPFLESWRGRKFTEQELQGFDVFKVLGAPCTLTVTHKLSGNGKTYAEVTGIGPVMEGMVCPPAVNDLFSFTVTDFTVEDFNKLPEFLQKEVKTSSEWGKLGAGQPVESTYNVPEKAWQPNGNGIPPHSDFRPNSPQPSAPLDGVQPEDGDGLPF